LHELRILEDFFYEVRPLEVKLTYDTNNLHVINNDLVECRCIISFLFSTINGRSDKKDYNNSHENENANDAQYICILFWALSTFKV
jgi:hypothetical protein